jgi:hypothetical protein
MQTLTFHAVGVVALYEVERLRGRKRGFLYIQKGMSIENSILAGFLTVFKAVRWHQFSLYVVRFALFSADCLYEPAEVYRKSLLSIQAILAVYSV